METTYADTSEFFLADVRRWLSPEADYGVHWRAAGKMWPEWRVTYIKDTGEVYAVCQHGQPMGPVILLGHVPPDPVTAGAGEVYCATLDVLLRGWEDPAVTGSDLTWVRDRLAAARRPA